jgi:3-oxoacyl-[acyl-carrier protein] reductase
LQKNTQALAGKVALVSGGSGWIGSGIARHLAAAGAKVAIVFHSNDAAAKEAVDTIQSAGDIATAFKGDITNESEVQKLVAEIGGKLGAVDILVNNALDSTVPGAPVEQQTWELYLRHLDYCLKAPLFLLKATIAHMKSARSGRVINIGSEQVEIADANNAHYVAAKGAMVGLTRSWANELGTFGITVNMVAPGWIAREGHGFKGDKPTPALENYLSDLAPGHVGTPDDVAAVVSFLAGAGGAFVTGQRIAVNGGKTKL